jgi:hypothetical protein
LKIFPGFYEMATLVVIFAQLAILVFQTVLLFGQQRLANRQLKILDRRSRLQFAFKDEPVDLEQWTPSVERTGSPEVSRISLDMVAHNFGNKASRDYYVTILFPQPWRLASIADPRGPTFRGSVEADGRPYAVYKCFVDKPLYPGRRVMLASLVFDTLPGSYTCLWNMADEDGSNPRVGEYGKIQVVVG